MEFNVFDYIRKHIDEIDSCSVTYTKGGEVHTFDVKLQHIPQKPETKTAQQLADEMVERLELVHGVDRKMLLSGRRDAKYAIPRDIIIYILSSYDKKFSPPVITATVGRNRCTWYNAIKVVRSMVNSNDPFYDPYRPMLSDLDALFGKR